MRNNCSKIDCRPRFSQFYQHMRFRLSLSTQFISVGLCLTALASCSDQSESISERQKRRGQKDLEFEKKLLGQGGDREIGRIGPEGSLHLTSEISFDDLLRQALKGGGNTIRLQNGYAASALDLKMSDHPLKLLTQIKPLRAKRLDLTACPITDSHLEDIKDLPFVALSLLGTNVRSISALKHMQTLQELRVGGDSINHDAMVVVSKLPKLESLDLSDTPITGADLLLLKDLSALRYLNISGCRKLTGSDITRLKLATKSKVLNLVGDEHDYFRAIKPVVDLVNGHHFEEADSMLVHILQNWAEEVPMNSDYLCRGYGKRAELFLMRGDIGNAQRNVAKALDYSRARGVIPYSRSTVWSVQADLYYKQKNYDLAEKAFKKAYKNVAEESSDARTREAKFIALTGLLKSQDQLHKKALLPIKG